MQTLTLTWHGKTVEFKPSFDLFMQIEEKVAFNRIANELAQAGAGNVADLPLSHVAWMLYCCLRHAGETVRTPMDVHQALFAGTIEYQGVLAGLIVAYYGSGPEKPPKKKSGKKAKAASTPCDPTSKSATASPSGAGASSRPNSGA